MVILLTLLKAMADVAFNGTDILTSFYIIFFKDSSLQQRRIERIRVVERMLPPLGGLKINLPPSREQTFTAYPLAVE